MHVIPLTVVDNFLDNPDMMRELAMTLSYSKDPNGEWPGVRSDSLYNIDQEIFDLLTKKFFSLFFDIKNIGWRVEARFQKVSKEYGSGWAHTDVGPIITGIIYLDPNPAQDSGTTILEKKQLNSNSVINNVDKVKFYQGNIDKQDAEISREHSNNNFSSGITVQSKYNRLLAFDSHLIHAAGKFYGNDDSERLTLVFFVFDISTAKTPIYRSKQHIL